MKKTYIYIIVIVIIIVAGVVWYEVAHKNSNTSSMNGMNMNSSNTSSSSGAPAATDAVTIQNFAFSPAAITVKQGSKVTWTNKDSVVHTVTETDGQTGPSSGNVDPGTSYSFTFSKAGTYHYRCSIHPDMSGTVTVTD